MHLQVCAQRSVWGVGSPTGLFPRLSASGMPGKPFDLLSLLPGLALSLLGAAEERSAQLGQVALWPAGGLARGGNRVGVSCIHEACVGLCKVLTLEWVRSSWGVLRAVLSWHWLEQQVWSQESMVAGDTHSQKLSCYLHTQSVALPSSAPPSLSPFLSTLGSCCVAQASGKIGGFIGGDITFWIGKMKWSWPLSSH